MRIVIPSLGRAGTANSMKWLAQSTREVVFYVHADEVAAYEKAYPQTTVMGLSDRCRKHTGRVRKEIMRDIYEPFIFVDDDIRVSLKATTSIDVMFDVLEHHIKCGASMAGLAPQLFSNFANTSLINGDLFAVRNKFVATVYAIDPKVFDNCPLEDLAVYEDVALVIHAIQYGGGTICTYVATHSNVSPPSGGCNSWRNEKITIDCLEKICQLYPEYCSIKTTNNTTHSQNIGIGLKTAWRKIAKKVN
jgi:hypothetical protein